LIQEYVLGFTIAFLIGIVASVFGIGGGVLFVPSLTLIFGLDPKTAIGTSLAIIVFSSLTGTITYRQQGRIFYKSAVVIILPSIACSVIGSLATAYIPGEILTLVFAGFLLIIALHILVPGTVSIPIIGSGPCFDDRCVDCYQNVIQVRPHYVHLLVWGAIGGFLGGITGIGGGVINVPALLSVSMPVHFAVATSTLIIFITSLSGALVHSGLGHTSIEFLALFATGSITGAFLGANIAPRIRSGSLKQGFGVFLLIIVAIMVLKIIT
jgi:uncharacterized membrane protein YfcA